MASFSTLATLSAEAIEEFTVLYGEYLEEHNVTGAPAPNEIKYWMLFKLTRGDFADEDSMITNKTMICNKNASKEAEEQLEQQPEQPSVEESVPPPPSSNLREAHTLKSSRIEVSVQGSDKVHKLELPFLPNCVDYSNTCQALKLNGNLLTPCLTKKSKKEGGDLCASCSKANAPLGRICDRMKFPIGRYVVEAESGKTKKIQKKEEMTFGTYIAKRGLTREQVEDKINQVFSGEIVIPEEHWVVDEKKAQKTVSAKSSENGSSDGDSIASKKSRKPRKTKKTEKAAEVASDEEESQPEELPEPKMDNVQEEVNNEETLHQEIVEPPCEDEMEEGEIDDSDDDDSDDDASVVDASDSEVEVEVNNVDVFKVEEKEEEKVEEEKEEEQVKQKKKPALKKKKPAVKKTKKTPSQSSQLEEEEPCEL